MKTVKSILFLFIIAALSIATPSCTKDAANANLKVSVQANNATYSLPVSAGIAKSTTSSPSITWLSGTMFVSQVAFKAERSESSTATSKSNIECSWKGPLNIDLFNTSSILGDITLPLGYYDKIELEVKLNKSDAAGTPVVYLTGSYTDASGTVIPVIFTSNEDMNFKAKKDGITITAASGSRFTAAIQIFMDQALLGVTLAQLDNAPLTNGNLEISATSNALLFNIMMTNMKAYQHCIFE
jgi:hypothetical protein